MNTTKSEEYNSVKAGLVNRSVIKVNKNQDLRNC